MQYFDARKLHSEMKCGSGDKDIAFVGTFYENDIITIRQDTALPLTVLAIFPRLTTFDI